MLLAGISERLVGITTGYIHQVVDVKQLKWNHELLRSGWEPAIYQGDSLNVLLLQHTCRLSRAAFGENNTMSVVILMNEPENVVKLAGIMVDNIYGISKKNEFSSTAVIRRLDIPGLFAYMDNPACCSTADLLVC